MEATKKPDHGNICKTEKDRLEQEREKPFVKWYPICIFLCQIGSLEKSTPKDIKGSSMTRSFLKQRNICKFLIKYTAFCFQSISIHFVATMLSEPVRDIEGL